MPKVRRYWFCAFLVLLSTVGLAQHVAANRVIVPVNASMVWSSSTHRETSTVAVKSPTGTTAYLFTLEPEYNIIDKVVVLELVLRRPGDNSDAVNRLDLTRHIHGYQSYVFAASDFVDGQQKSIYGPTRIIRRDKLGLMVRIDVAGAVVRDGGFDELRLKVEVRNLDR